MIKSPSDQMALKKKKKRKYILAATQVFWGKEKEGRKEGRREGGKEGEVE